MRFLVPRRLLGSRHRNRSTAPHHSISPAPAGNAASLVGKMLTFVQPGAKSVFEVRRMEQSGTQRFLDRGPSDVLSGHQQGEYLCRCARVTGAY